jgi:hypothetical protein
VDSEQMIFLIAGSAFLALMVIAILVSGIMIKKRVKENKRSD